LLLCGGRWHQVLQDDGKGAKMMVARGGDYLCGRIAPAILLRVLLPLAVSCFVVSLGLALAFFPALDDLRHRWVSALGSSRHNRLGHVYFGAGLAALSVFLIPLPGYLSRRMAFSKGVRRAGLLFLGAGIAGLLLLGLETTIVQHLVRVRGLHRTLSMVTFSGLTLGFLCFAALSISRAAAIQSKRWPAFLACFVLVAPGVGTCLTQLFMAFGSGALGWPTSREAKLAVPFFRTLPFWEWMAVTSLFVGGYLSVWSASLEAPAPTPERGSGWLMQAAAGQQRTTRG
jgi:hypothetical protein